MAKKAYRVISPIRIDGQLHRSGTIECEPKALAGVERCVAELDPKAEADAKTKAEADAKKAAKE